MHTQHNKIDAHTNLIESERNTHTQHNKDDQRANIQTVGRIRGTTSHPIRQGRPRIPSSTTVNRTGIPLEMHKTGMTCERRQSAAGGNVVLLSVVLLPARGD